MDGIVGAFKGIPITYCKCGITPRIIETYDTLQIICESCGLAGNKYFGDYYDEGFMLQTYADKLLKNGTRWWKNENL